MAQFPNYSILLIALTLIATKLALTNAQLGLINGTNIAQVSVRGLITCSIPSPLLFARPLAGVNVSLSCDEGTTTLGTALTDPSGFFDIVSATVDDLLFHPNSNCSVIAKLGPGLNCTVFPPQGILRSPLTTLGVVGSVLGLVLRIFAPVFTLLNVQ